jgi:hypothetical protein
MKQFDTVMKQIKNAKTADDLWTARIEFDKLFPESVKKFSPNANF